MGLEKDNRSDTSRQTSKGKVVKPFRNLGDLGCLISDEDTLQSYIFKNSPNTRSNHGKEVEDLLSLILRKLDTLNPSSAKDFDGAFTQKAFSEYQGLTYCASTKKHGTVLCLFNQDGLFFKPVRYDWNEVRELDVDIRYSLVTTHHPPSILGFLGEPDLQNGTSKVTTYVVGTSTDPVLIHFLHRNCNVHDISETDLKVRGKNEKQTKTVSSNRHKGNNQHHIPSRTERWSMTIDDIDEDARTVLKTFAIKRYIVSTCWNAHSKVLKSNVTNITGDFCICSFNPRALGLSQLGEFRDITGKRTGTYLVSTETALKCVLKLSALKYARTYPDVVSREGIEVQSNGSLEETNEQFFSRVDEFAVKHLDVAMTKHRSPSGIEFEIRRTIHPLDFGVQTPTDKKRTK